MIEVRRDLDLPSVNDGDPEVIPKLSELLGEVIECNIPGLGLVHTSERQRPHLGMHHWHMNLVMRAAMSLDPPIVTEGFEPAMNSHDFGYGTDLHTDLSNKRLEYAGEAHMMLRLHTTDNNNAAKVVLVATNPGRFRKDTDFYLSIPAAGAGMDTTILDSNIYHFEQQPNDSVLFRSMSNLGAVTAHQFTALDQDQPRRAYATDLSVYGQLAELL